MINAPYQKYQQIQAQTAPKSKLLIMLYDGAIRFVRAGIEGIEERNYEKSNNNLCKAQAIIHELVSALDFSYAISNDLNRLYEYMMHQLIDANVRKSDAPAKEVLGYLIELRDTWFEASKNSSDAGSM
ncbi:flagellar export chaperone FliS [Paenibacillus sp. CMAA1364]